VKRHNEHETVERRRWHGRAALVLACTCGTLASPVAAAGDPQPKPSPTPLWQSFPLRTAPRHATPAPKPPAATPAPQPPAQTPPAPAAQKPARPPAPEPVRGDGNGRSAIVVGVIALVGLAILACLLPDLRRLRIRPRRLLRVWDVALDGLYDAGLWVRGLRIRRRRLLGIWDALLDDVYDLGLWVRRRPRAAADRLYDLRRPRLELRRSIRRPPPARQSVVASADALEARYEPAAVEGSANGKEPATSEASGDGEAPAAPALPAEVVTPSVDAAPATTKAPPADDDRSVIAAELDRARDAYAAVSLVLVRADNAAAADGTLAALAGDLDDTHSGRAGEDGVGWVLLTGVRPKRACDLAEAVLAGDDGAGPFRRVAIGIAGFPRHARTAEGLLRLARRALADATAEGGGTVVVARDVWRDEEEPAAEDTAVEDAPIGRELLHGVGYPIEQRPLGGESKIGTS
jgi:hypothetical protein